MLFKLGGKDSGLPFHAFLDAKGELIASSERPAAGKTPGGNIGHPFAPDEIAWFMTMLRKAAPKMSDKDQGAVESWLKNQKKD